MTNQQIRWAVRHDWYIGHKNGVVIVRDDLDPCGFLSFSDFEELYEWAGY